MSAPALPENWPYKVPLWDKDGNIIDYAFVSQEDYDNVMKYRWNVYKQVSSAGKEIRYATGYISKDEQCIRMHHLVIGKPPKDMVVDHWNRNGLDNRKENLRFATYGQNAQNKSSTKDDTSDSMFMGVYQVPCNKKWRASAFNIYLGTFEKELEAARMYDKYSLLKYGPGANTNGLVTYEEVKNLDLDALLKSVKNARSDRKLPQNIGWFQDKYYRVRVTYNGIEHSVGYFTDLDEAVKARDEFKAKIKEVDKKVEELHNEREITRNQVGQAVIPTWNDKGEVNGHAIVDDDKWHELMKFSWNMNHLKYVFTRIDGQSRSMHSYLLKAEEGKFIDHANGIKFDNRLCNLRQASLSENGHNKSKQEGTSSIYWGVTYSKSHEKWLAHITKEGTMNRLGYYDEEDEAALAYNKAAEELYGSFAKLNIIGIPSHTLKEEPASVCTETLKKHVEEHESKAKDIKDSAVLKEIERKSPYRGVTQTLFNKWSAEVFKDKERFYLGIYDTAEDAARAYNKKAKELYGNNAKLNPVEGDIEIKGRKAKSSQYRGVSYNGPKRNTWSVLLRDSSGKEVRGGTYKTEVEAALAYNEKAKEVHGAKAKLNVVPQGAPKNWPALAFNFWGGTPKN